MGNGGGVCAVLADFRPPEVEPEPAARRGRMAERKFDRAKKLTGTFLSGILLVTSTIQWVSFP